jgi:hypothetical protein
MPVLRAVKVELQARPHAKSGHYRSSARLDKPGN